MTPPIPLLTRNTTEFALPDHLLEPGHLPIAPERSLLPYDHLFVPGEISTLSKTYVPIIGPPAMHSATSTNEATSNVPDASVLSTHEGFPPITSVPTLYPRSFPISNRASLEFQEGHQPQYNPTICSPSTQRSVSLSPTVSSSPLASSCSSCRHPVRVEPKVILSNQRLQALVLQILSEPWFINHQAERNLTDKEATDGLGFAGKSVFLAFASRLRDGSERAGKWRCLICDTLPVTLSNGKVYIITREDRILKHIRHHFGHRPWVCGGQCGTKEW